MRRKRPFLLNVLAAFFLALGGAGCQAVDDLSVSVSEEWSRLMGRDAQQTAKPAPPEEKLPKTAQLVPQRLIGLDQREVTDLLGPAIRAREVSPAVVWEYRLSTCALDIFFYLDLASQRFRALAYDMRSADGKEDKSLAFCLDRIREQNRVGKG